MPTDQTVSARAILAAVMDIRRRGTAAVLEELRKRGHTIKPASTATFGGYQAIRRDPDTGVYCSATESRKDGHAAGY